MNVDALPTPALVIDLDALESNLATMARALPGARLRPHVKAHKCTALARAQAAHGHPGFTCATPREVLGMAAAGLGDDLLLANETLDAQRLAAMARLQPAVTVAVDSPQTIDAAAEAGIARCLIDVNVGLNRCGAAIADAAALARRARDRGIAVRGVMGYEGHLMMVRPREERARRVAEAMALLRQAHDAVGGAIVSAGGTGTYDLHEHTGVTEIQAGSYALMDHDYAQLGQPFGQALYVLGTVISVSPGHAVADVGLKALAMDHGNPQLPGAQVRSCSDEHMVFVPGSPVRPGDRVRVIPGHVDPTMAMHEAAWLVRGQAVVDRWAIDLRGW